MQRSAESTSLAEHASRGGRLIGRGPVVGPLLFLCPGAATLAAEGFPPAGPSWSLVIRERAPGSLVSLCSFMRCQSANNSVHQCLSLLRGDGERVLARSLVQIRTPYHLRHR